MLNLKPQHNFTYHLTGLLVGNGQLCNLNTEQSTLTVEQPLSGVSFTQPVAYSLGNRQYELKNHLGNVLATVSGFKNTTTNTASLLTAQDYYPFGSIMPGRSFGNGYRFGFNGKETDNEWSGQHGATYDYGFRIYDSRIAKFLSVDLLTGKYPWYTPYQFAGNKPIQFVDLDGLEEGMAMHQYAIWTCNRKNPTVIKTFDEINFKIAIGGLQNLGLAASIWYNPTNALSLGGIGATIGGIFSSVKGDDSYDIMKNTISGFYSGAALAFGPKNLSSYKELLEISGVGGFSGIISNSVEQTIDNMSGNQDGYNMTPILENAALSAIANVFSAGLIKNVNLKIDQTVKKALENTKTDSFREALMKSIKKENPRIGNRELNKTVNDRLISIIKLIEKQGENAKASLQQSIDRGSDILEEQGEETINKSN